MNVGLDIGSTTIKCVVINEAKEIVYQSYERHKSRVREKMCIRDRCRGYRGLCG